jgi:SWI/SNF-related matrix-associated actin-dependent regulator 1 of chromatin subfamily A
MSAPLPTLYPYQIAGAQWLAKTPQAMLADEMGLGKTVQAITACDLVAAKDILIVCPAAARINWCREFKKFSRKDHPIYVIDTREAKPKPGVNIISYDLLAGCLPLIKALKAVAWDVLVMDEAHFCKERTAKRTKALYGVGNNPGVMHSSKRTWRLTGTPVPNNASELYTHLKSAGIVDKTFWDFVFEFCAGFDANYGYKITGNKNVERLRALMEPFILRRKKNDVLKQLPIIQFEEVHVERSNVPLDPYFFENWALIGQEKFMQSLEHIDKTLKDSLLSVRNARKAEAEDNLDIIKAYTKNTATLRRYIGLAKLPAALEIVRDDLKSGRVKKIVLFALHQQVIDTTRRELRKYGPVTLYGNTPPDKKQDNIDRFMNDPTCRVFIGQIHAAGTAITLTSAHHVAFLEADWVPANNAQAAMRCHRIGQTKPVSVRFFTCKGTVDEQVMRTIAKKTKDIAQIID